MEQHSAVEREVVFDRWWLDLLLGQMGVALIAAVECPYSAEELLGHPVASFDHLDHLSNFEQHRLVVAAFAAVEPLPFAVLSFHFGMSQGEDLEAAYH